MTKELAKRARGKPKVRSKRKKRKALDGTDPRSITIELYERAWLMFRSLADRRDILNVCDLTQKQYHWLLRTGNEKKGMVPFGDRLAVEISAIRSQAIEAGKKVSARGVRVLDQGLKNTEAANIIVGRILFKIGADLEANEKRRGRKKSLESLMPGSVIRHTLQTLLPYTKMNDVVSAYKLLYETSPGKRAGEPAGGGGGFSLPTEDVNSMPALVAFLEETAGEESADEFRDQLLPEMKGWSRAKLDYFARTGDENPPDDLPEIIDAEATETG